MICIFRLQCEADFFFFALKSSTFSGNVGKRRVKLNSPNLCPTIPSRISNGTNTLPLCTYPHTPKQEQGEMDSVVCCVGCLIGWLIGSGVAPNPSKVYWTSDSHH